MHKAKLRRAGWRVRHAEGRWLAAGEALDRARARARKLWPHWPDGTFGDLRRRTGRVDAWARAYGEARRELEDLPAVIAHDAMIRRHGR